MCIFFFLKSNLGVKVKVIMEELKDLVWDLVFFFLFNTGNWTQGLLHVT